MLCIMFTVNFCQAALVVFVTGAWAFDVAHLCFCCDVHCTMVLLLHWFGLLWAEVLFGLASMVSWLWWQQSFARLVMAFVGLTVMHVRQFCYLLVWQWWLFLLGLDVCQVYCNLHSFWCGHNVCCIGCSVCLLSSDVCRLDCNICKLCGNAWRLWCWRSCEVCW